LSFRDGNQEIYVINADGSDLKNISAHEGADFDPDWSPDGSKIVFNSDREGAGIYVMNADGSDVQRLTAGGVSPTWSPDGTRIAYSRGGSLVIIDPDGDNPSTIYDGGGSDPVMPCSGGAILGDWSPDGEWIAFYTADLSRGAAEICVVATDGSEIKLIVENPPGIHVEPNWSPDSTRIAFRSIRDGIHQIYVYDLATGEQTRLTEHAGLDAEPAWSPDGGWIAFVSDRDALESDIYVMSADGSDLRRLTTHARKDSFPTWAP
jgi:TolB protein